jgi:hypothetical protein
VTYPSALALTIALLWVPATATATPTDTLATKTYLQAGYELDHAVNLHVAASNTKASQFTATIARECHGVLAGAPNEELDPALFTPRAQGERQRGELELQTIEEELRQAFYDAFDQPNRSAIEAFAAQVTPLSWSNPQVATAVHIDVRNLQEYLTPAPPVCADMRAWAQSGYLTLSPASQAFQAEQKALAAVPGPLRSIGSLLKPYEDAGDRILIAHTQALRSGTAKAFKGIETLYRSLHRAVGVPEAEPEVREQEKILGRGKTEAGESFVVRKESSNSTHDRSCRRKVSVELTSTTSNGRSADGTDSSVCLSDQSRHQPPTGCDGDGVWSVTTAVPASVWTVRLRLGNGRTLTSKVVRVAPGEGGPGGVYVQSLRPRTPHAMSLTELDREGKVVRVVKLAPFPCEVEPRSQEGPTFVPLARGSTPEGEPFTIDGVLVHVGREETSFNLSLEAGTEGQANEGEERSSGDQIRPRIFSWSLATGCPPDTYSILYGTLAAPGTSVSALTSGGLVPLTEVQLASNLHAEGPLFYGVFPTPPTELVVQGSDGETLSTDSLTARAQEEREFCEGYGEG